MRAFDNDTAFLWGEPWVLAQCTPFLPLIKWADGGRLIDTIFGLSIAPLSGNFSSHQWS